MNRTLKFLLWLWAATILAYQGTQAWALGTAFTYQGQLEDSGVPANGSYDFAFTLYFSPTNAAATFGSVTNSGVVVSNGVFTTSIDFGNGGGFTGGNRWLGIYVSPHGSNTFTRLEPLQAINPTPYAIYSQKATTILGYVPTSQLQGLIPASSITGSLSLDQLPPAALTNGEVGVTLSGQFSGAFNGDGGGLTNLNGSKVVGTIPDSSLSTNVAAIHGFIALRTNTYSSAGIYQVVVPPGASQLTARIWGAGGTGPHQASGAGSGGGGAFAQRTILVDAGQVFTVVVGQRGSAGGGEGSGNAAGGFRSNGGRGGQGSSLFLNSGTNFILQGLAGGGGGGADQGPGGAGGNPGQAGQLGAGGGFDGKGGAGGIGDSNVAGFDYATNATTVGIGLLASGGGNGGKGSTGGGSGGGGFGGGGGGRFDPASFSNGAGSGGGSYGDLIVAGNYSTPGNTNDAFYIAPAGRGDTTTAGPDGDGLVVLLFQLPGTQFPGLLSATRLAGNGEGLIRVTASGVVPGATLASLVISNSILNGVTITNSLVAGDGAKLVNLNASQIATGTIPAERLPSVVVTNNQSGVTLNGTFGGSIGGDGGGLNNLNASRLASGVVPLERIPGTVVTNSASGVTLGGSFAGSVTLNTTMNAVNNPIFLSGPNDATCGLAYSLFYSNFAGIQDGPVLWGKGGGFLATSDGRGNVGLPLQWTRTGVIVQGTFNNLSDRNAKQDFRSINLGQILDKVLSLPLSEWSYKSDTETRHIGPMAQDFFAAFQVGTDDRHIAPIDEGGVAFAAIQALNQKIEAKDAEIAQLKQDMADLKKLVERMADKK